MQPPSRPLVQIVLSFYQVATVIDSTYSTSLPHWYTDWTNQFEILGALDWAKFTGISTKCLMGDFEQQMIVKVRPCGCAIPSACGAPRTSHHHHRHCFHYNFRRHRRRLRRPRHRHTARRASYPLLRHRLVRRRFFH